MDVILEYVVLVRDRTVIGETKEVARLCKRVTVLVMPQKETHLRLPDGLIFTVESIIQSLDEKIIYLQHYNHFYEYNNGHEGLVSELKEKGWVTHEELLKESSEDKSKTAS